ncbi:MAG: polysaccharide biosynthesis C-terminal domain-containing protein, partial [Patescibacteria group bacterium]
QKNDSDKVSAVFRRSIRMSILITAVLTIMVLIYGYNLIFYWLGPIFAGKTIVAVYYLAFTYFILSINMFIHFFLAGTKRLKTNVVFGSIIAILGIIFMFILIPKYQVNGAAIAFLISSLPVPVFLYYVEKKYLANRTKDIIFYYSRHIAEVAFVGVIVYFISRQFFVPLASNLFITIIFGMLSFILYFVIYYLFGFINDQEKFLFKEFSAKILSKVKFT